MQLEGRAMPAAVRRQGGGDWRLSGAHREIPLNFTPSSVPNAHQSGQDEQRRAMHDGSWGTRRHPG